MRVGDLFSGIGGFSLAAEWMGWTTAWFSEIDPYASRVLATHWPDVSNLGDITRIDWTTVEPVDLITGGFPCQPHSLAGKRQASDDSRDLWSECVRALRILRPRYAVFENVPGLFTSDGGRFFNRVLHDVAALGYDAEWRVLSAADVGAPHRRERVWITVADANRRRREQRDATERSVPVVDAIGAAMAHPADTLRRPHGRSMGGGESCEESEARTRGIRSGDGCAGNDGFAESSALVPNPTRGGQSMRWQSRDGAGFAAQLHTGFPDADEFGASLSTRRRVATEQFARRASATTSDPRGREWWATEPDVGRVAHGIPARVDRLRCLGNSIVPACALEIFRAIEARETVAHPLARVCPEGA